MHTKDDIKQKGTSQKACIHCFPVCTPTVKLSFLKIFTLEGVFQALSAFCDLKNQFVCGCKVEPHGNKLCFKEYTHKGGFNVFYPDTDCTFISDRAGLQGNWIHSTLVTQQDLTICAASHTLSVCVWPLDQEDYILIVIQQGPTAPLDSSQPYGSSSPIHRQQKALSCCLAFSLGRVLTVRPYNCLTVSVYSPFCPLFPVPLADPAVRPIPAEMTCDMSELGATSSCIWQSSERLWLASGKKKKKRIQTDVCATCSQQICSQRRRSVSRVKNAWTDRSENVQL